MSARDAQASNWVAERADATGSVFDLKGSSKSYTSFSRAFSAGDTVFYSAHDEQGNREAGYGVFNGSTELTRNPTATLVNNVYSSSSPSEVSFSGEVTVACTFNASAFNTLWKALDAIDPDGDGGINIPPELIDGLLDTLNSKADQVDLEKEIQDRIDGDKALQDQIDALDPDGDLVIDWSEIEGKPTEFPPEAHNHDGVYAPIGHGHEIDDVNGLQDALDAAGGTPAWDDVTGKPTEFPPAAHTQDWSTITNTPSEYPPEAHTHEQGDVDGLELRLEAIEDSITSGGGFVDAPDDGKLYGRQSEAWAEVVIPDVADPDWSDIQNKPTEFPPSDHNHDGDYQPVGDYITDAPNDGKPYVRKSEAWEEMPATGGGGSSLWEQNGSDIYYDSGNVGIGTDNPTVKLAVLGANGDQLFLDNSGERFTQATLRNNGVTKSSWSYDLTTDRVDFYSSTSLGFSTGGNTASQKVVIAADGNVGIGNEAPYNKLDIKSSPTNPLASSESQLALRNVDGRASYVTFDNSADLTVYNTGGKDGTGGDTVFHQTSGEAMRIAANGRVGIGTDLPTSELHLRVSGANNGAQITFDSDYGIGYVGQENNANNNLIIGSSTAGVTFYSNNTERMNLDSTGRLGIGGTPSRSAGEIAKEAKDKLARWRSTFDERLKAEPKADKKAITLEITDDEFSTFPTEETLVERLQERNIGGGAAKLQVAGDGYFSGIVKTLAIEGVAEGGYGLSFNQAGEKAITPIVGGAALGGQVSLGTATAGRTFKDGHFSGTVSAAAVQFGGYGFTAVGSGGAAFVPAGTGTTGTVSLGNASYKWLDGHFSGTVNATTINGTVTDVPAHVKAITPTQIANWDAGTGGGGGGATTDGRISDTQISNWDTAFGWGNHASAGYQPAGSYLTASDLSGYATESWVTSNYQPRGSYLTSSDLNGYATESWVNSQGFAKGSFVPTSGNTTISGTLTATDFVATSDERLKDDISPMPVGLIDDIKPAQWTWKDSGKKSAGVIAQQLQEIGLDDFVSEDEDGMLGVNYNALTSVLLAEVIALKKQVQELSK